MFTCHFPISFDETLDSEITFIHKRKIIYKYSSFVHCSSSSSFNSMNYKMLLRKWEKMPLAPYNICGGYIRKWTELKCQNFKCTKAKSGRFQFYGKQKAKMILFLLIFHKMNLWNSFDLFPLSKVERKNFFFFKAKAKKQNEMTVA